MLKNKDDHSAFLADIRREKKTNCRCFEFGTNSKIEVILLDIPDQVSL